MKYYVKESNSLKDFINGKTIKLSNYKNIIIINNFILIGEQGKLNLEPYKEYKFLNGNWYKGKYFIDLIIQYKVSGTDNYIPKQQTFIGKNFINNIKLFIKFSILNKIKKIMRCIGSILNIILNIKKNI